MGSLGIYTSYNEHLNGHIQEAVDISVKRRYVIWLLKSKIKRKRFNQLRIIVLRIKGEERFYRGKIHDIKSVTDVPVEEILSETSHRPKKWQEIDREIYKDFKSVLYIKGLIKIPKPHEVVGKHPPQGLYYIKFGDI
jgi:hypothetical protein